MNPKTVLELEEIVFCVNKCEPLLFLYPALCYVQITFRLITAI